MVLSNNSRKSTVRLDQLIRLLFAKVLPVCSRDYLSYGSPAYSVFRREKLLGKCSSGVFLSDFLDLIFIQFAIAYQIAVFSIAIIIIILGRSLEKMGWIYARSIIAMVADKKFPRVRISGKYPRQAVCTCGSFANGKYSITRVIEQASPNPAWPKIGTMRWYRTIFVNLGPESLCQLVRSAFIGDVTFVGTIDACCCKKRIEHALTV